jgi:hypothetical protein
VYSTRSPDALRGFLVRFVTFRGRDSFGQWANAEMTEQISPGAHGWDRRRVTSSPAGRGITVGITNTRLSASKRGIAAELAERLAAAARVPVCLVGADPTDRDVERRLPQFLVRGGDYRRSQVDFGVHHLEVTSLPSLNLFLVTLSDRTMADSVLPRLSELFEFVIIDAPSRVGSGVGIARILFRFLDALVISSELRAGDLAMTRVYLDQIAQMPSARHATVRVVTSGDANQSGLAPEQLERKLSLLPVVANIPSMSALPRDAASQVDDPLAAAFEPLVSAVLALRQAQEPDPKPATPSAWTPARRSAVEQRYLR